MMAVDEPESLMAADDEPTGGEVGERVHSGNRFDVSALVAAVVGAVALLTCGTMGYGMYCMPLVPLALGIVGLVTARQSVDEGRTRLLSWIGVGTGAFVLLLSIGLFLLWLALIAFAVAGLTFGEYGYQYRY
jgi:hypothetical protein